MSGAAWLTVTPAWHTAYPGAVAGLVVLHGVANPETHPALDGPREALERDLRERFGGLSRDEIRATAPLPAYDAYYRRFGQTYHVLRQLESVAQKGKSIPRRAALVEAMFIAELERLLLTAGHDLAVVQPPTVVDVASGGERYVGIGGAEQSCKAGDMLMRDADGIVSSIITGPDSRTKITPATTDVAFAVYAPAGIGETTVRAHLERMAELAGLIAPGVETTAIVAIVAGAPTA